MYNFNAVYARRSLLYTRLFGTAERSRMMSWIQSILKEWLLALAIASPIIASAEAELTLIGTHENWTAYELRDGEIQLCYVETGLAESPVPHERLAGTVLVVTHQSMIRGGGMMARFRVGPNFPQVDSQLDLHNFDFLDFRKDGAPSGFIGDFVEAGYLIGDFEAADLSALGFSLEGFSQAYEMIRQACPEASNSFRPDPVYVSDVRMVGNPPDLHENMSYDEENALIQEWLLTHEPYMEFDVVGRLFVQGREYETLTVRRILSLNNSGARSLVSDAESPSFDYLARATNRIDYYRNGRFLGSDERPPYKPMYQFLGSCAVPPAGGLYLLFREHSGAPGDIGSYFAMYPGEDDVSYLTVENVGVEEVESFDGEVVVTASDCAENQSRWTWGGAFTPCVCRGWHDVENPYHLALEGAKWDFYRAAARENPRMDDDRFTSLFGRLSKLKPFSWWDPRVGIYLSEFESTEYQVASVWFHDGTFDDRPRGSGSFQYIFARHLGSPTWLRIHGISRDSRGRWWESGSVSRIMGRHIVNPSLVAVSGFTDAHLLEVSYEGQDQVIDLNKLFSEADGESAGEH